MTCSLTEHSTIHVVPNHILFCYILFIIAEVYGLRSSPVGFVTSASSKLIVFICYILLKVFYFLFIIVEASFYLYIRFCCRGLHRLGTYRVLRRVVGGQQQQHHQRQGQSPVTDTRTHSPRAPETHQYVGTRMEVEGASTPATPSEMIRVTEAWTCLQVSGRIF